MVGAAILLGRQVMSVLRLLDWLRGSGEYAVTIPSMDGALKPNDELDRAAVLADITEPDNLGIYPSRAALF